MKTQFVILGIAAAALMPACASKGIDRHALVERNNPHVTSVDTMASLTVGNGEFAFTVDVTGLQSFPEVYTKGVPLGTQSQWGWHSFANPEGYEHSETLKSYDFGHGHEELYSTQFKEAGRQKDASNWYRINPHRLHLGAIGFAGVKPDNISDIDQTLDMWTGVIHSSYNLNSTPVTVTTACDPSRDMIAAEISNPAHTPVAVRLPYPTGAHADDACDWTKDDLHLTEIVSSGANSTVLRHTLDSTTYYITLTWEGNATSEMTGRNEWTLTPADDKWSFTAEFTQEANASTDVTAENVIKDSSAYWENFWTTGGVVDFSHCTDPRAAELERRVVLSQYLLATQCAGSTPPQETGLIY
ncbi:MAG: hypothetical protein K2K72_05375, partial [Duncaniella sp.]|nr:hypothetical protein [Duncaniella sp.]